MISAFSDMLNVGNKVGNIVGKQEHKGLFGLSGTPRDILGLIGDALLVGGGGNPLYMQARKNEKIGDAMLWNDLDPMTAGQKLMGIDPKLGQAHIADYQDAQAKKAQLEQAQRIADRNYQFGVDNENNNRYEKVAPGVYGMLASANEKTYPSIRAKAQAVADKYSVQLPYELPETYDPSISSGYRDLAINPTAQAQIAATDRRSAAQLEISRGNLGVSRGNLAVREGEAGEKKRVGQYTGEDGKVRIIWDDGTETVSQSKEQPRATGGSGRPRPGGAAPASGNGPPPPRKVGDKIRAPDGTILVSKDGKTWSK